MSSRTSDAVFADLVFPEASRLQNLLLVVSGSLLLALCAQVSVPLPFSPVPVTGQTFGVLLLGASLGGRRGFSALLLYLAEGAAGLPVFAPGGSPGFARLLGPTGGYLLAFPAAAFVMGWFVGRARRRFWWVGALAAQSLVLLSGAAWLEALTGMGLGEAVRVGVVPFLPGELVKTGLLAVCLPATGHALERHRREKP